VNGETDLEDRGGSELIKNMARKRKDTTEKGEGHVAERVAQHVPGKVTLGEIQTTKKEGDFLGA